MARSASRVSNASIARSSVIAQILSQSPEEAVETHAHAGSSHPHGATDLRRFEAADEAKPDDRPILRVEPAEGGMQVHQRGLVDIPRLGGIRDGDLPDRAAVPAA